MVRLDQEHYAEALVIYTEALKTFESLCEPGSVASIWHQIGVVHRKAGSIGRAEHAYRQALAIRVQQHDLAGECGTLTELGVLYSQTGRLEDAVTLYRQAVEIDVNLQDLRAEGFDRNNLASALFELQRYDEARPEALRAIECKKPFGHSAAIWKTWAILYKLEQATGAGQAAEAARGQAIGSYLAYRRAGGESRCIQAEFFALVSQAIQQGEMTGAEETLDELSKGDLPAWGQTLLPKLQAILRGDRNPALAADPNMDLIHAAELQLLLEALGTQ
jgi:tetratricopeptide (TPR) repeat protein